MSVIIITVISILVLLILFKIGEKYDKYHKSINIGISIFLLSIILCVIYGYSVTHNTKDVLILTHAIDIIDSDVGDLDIDSNVIDTLGVDEIVRIYNTQILNNNEYAPNLKISEISDMYTFTDKFSFANEASEWVECFVKYTGWCLAEYTLDTECDDYWEMKYKSSDKVASYNYGLLIKYKVQGYFIKNASMIAFCAVVLQAYVWSYWFIISKKDLFTRRNKSDLQN